MLIGQTLWTEFFSNKDWPVASAVAVALLCVLVLPLVLYQRMQHARSRREGGEHAHAVLVQFELDRDWTGLSLSADRASW